MKFYVITLKITTLLSKTPSLFNGLRLIAVGNILFYQNYHILLVLIVKKKLMIQHNYRFQIQIRKLKNLNLQIF